MCLSPGADKRQSMGEFLTTWFPSNDRTIYIMIQRKEPDVEELPGPLEGDDEVEKAGKGGKGEGKGKGRGRGRPKKEIKPKVEPVEDVSFEDFSFGLDAEVDALEAEWDALDADLGIDGEVFDVPNPEMLDIPSLSSSRKRSNSDLSHLQPRTRTRQQLRRALADGL